MAKPAGPDASATGDGSSRTREKEKNANEIITLRRRRGMLYAGLDVHKKTIQVAVLDGKKNILLNEKIPHTPEAVREMAGRLPDHAKYILESSSVWEGSYRLMTEESGLDVTLSNPYTTLLRCDS